MVTSWTGWPLHRSVILSEVEGPAFLWTQSGASGESCRTTSQDCLSEFILAPGGQQALRRRICFAFAKPLLRSG